jgi:hypothetical protein
MAANLALRDRAVLFRSLSRLSRNAIMTSGLKFRHIERNRFDMHLRGNKLEQEAKRVAVARERLGTDVSMRQQTLDEKFLKQWPHKSIDAFHDLSPEVANEEKRSEALPSSSGVAETYR